MSLGGRKFNEKKARKQRRSVKQKCKRAFKTGDDHSGIEFARLYLDSENIKVLTAQEIREEMRPHMRPSMAALQEIASNADVWSESNEPVYASAFPKDGSNRDHRPILSFGFENKLRQILARDIVKLHFKPHSRQFLLNGGRHKAIDAAKAGWKKGFQYGFHLDLETFFQKIEGEKLHKFLKLPMEVINNVVLAKGYNLVTSRSLSRILGELDENLPIEDGLAVLGVDVEAFRRGIPQGSTLSPLCAEVVLHEVVSALPDFGVVVNYADDFLVLCKAPNDRAAMLSALKEALVSHPAGTLTPGSIVKFDPNDNFSFLGYDIKPIGDGGLKFEIGRRARTRLNIKTSFLLNQLESDDIKDRKKVAIVKSDDRYVTSFASNFPEWRGRSRFLKWRRKRVEIWTDLAGIYCELPPLPHFGLKRGVKF